MQLHGLVLRSLDVLLNIVKIYIVPILEYGQIIWSQNRFGYSEKLERVMSYASRWAMNTPYRSDDLNYMTYSNRLAALGSLTLQDRR